MKLIEQSTESFNGELITRFKYDHLNSPEEVLRIVDVMRSFGLNVESLTAMEFGDYDDDKKIITYLNSEKFNSLVEDFQNIGVEAYNMHGSIRQTKFVATVYPDINVFSIRYDSAFQKEVEDIARKMAE